MTLVAYTDKQVRDKSCLSLAAETPCSYCLHYKLFFFCYLSKQSTFLTFPIVLLFFFLLTVNLKYFLYYFLLSFGSCYHLVEGHLPISGLTVEISF